ncbi:MAG: hypothetical protein ACYCV4_13380, partial [Dermatophilaceae bacterium]
PTAPVWADPTAPIPATPAAETPSAWVQDAPEVPLVPPAPPGAAYPYGQQPLAPQATAPAAPPLSNPYAQQPPASPWVPSQPDPYGQPAGQYGQAQPGQQYPAYGQQPYATGATTAPSNTSAIILTILSGVSMLFGNILTVGSLVFGIMALTSNSTDPVGSRKKTKTGWIVFAVVWAVGIVGAIAAIILFVGLARTGGMPSSGGGY